MVKRTLVKRQGKKRLVKRKTQGKQAGQFAKGSQPELGRAIASDRRKKAKTTVRSGQGYRGDTKPRKPRKK